MVKLIDRDSYIVVKDIQEKYNLIKIRETELNPKLYIEWFYERVSGDNIKTNSDGSMKYTREI